MKVTGQLCISFIRENEADLVKASSLREKILQHLPERYGLRNLQYAEMQSGTFQWL